MILKEIAFMKKKGASKSMLRHEEAEARQMGVAVKKSKPRKGKGR